MTASRSIVATLGLDLILFLGAAVHGRPFVRPYLGGSVALMEHSSTGIATIPPRG